MIWRIVTVRDPKAPGGTRQANWARCECGRQFTDVDWKCELTCPDCGESYTPPTEAAAEPAKPAKKKAAKSAAKSKLDETAG